MTSGSPRVSALTILHNRRHVLAETIRSVLDQTYPVFEYIIIDDGSTDEPLQVISAFKDPRIRYIYFPRIGVVSKLRNLAISQASGDYCAFIDSDDLWHSEKIAKHVDTATESGATLVLSDCQYFNAEGHFGKSIGSSMVNRQDLLAELVQRNLSLAFGTSFFFRNLPGITVFDESLYLGDHDFVGMLLATQRSVYIPEVLNYIRRHELNMSAEGSILELVSPLEYNRTIDKMLAAGAISPAQHRGVKASNYIKAAFACYQRKRHRQGLLFSLQALKRRVNLQYLAVTLKITWALLRRGTR